MWLETHFITAHQKEHYYKLKKTCNADQPHSANKKSNNKSASFAFLLALQEFVEFQVSFRPSTSGMF